MQVDFAGKHVDYEKIGEVDVAFFGSAVYMSHLSPLLVDNINNLRQQSPNATVALFSVGLAMDNQQEFDLMSKDLVEKADYNQKFNASESDSQTINQWIEDIINRMNNA